MVHQAEVMNIPAVRAIAAQAVRQQPIPDDLVQAARKALQSMCHEAAEYGLTTADVVRAVLHPVLEEKRGCDCPICEARRSQGEEEQLRRWLTRPLEELPRRESVSQ